MDKKNRITVALSGQGTRLDKFLRRHLPDLSRTRLQQLIKTGQVTVGNARPSPHYEVRDGDVITVVRPDPVAPDLKPEPIPLDILYEDDALLVVNKPGDLLIHPLPNVTTGTLVNALLHHCPDLSGINGRAKPGIVHRLDKNTSGCLVVAKTDAVHRELSRQFKDREVYKEYVAICWGHLKEKQGRIATRIGRDQHRRNRMSTLPAKGREAVSLYRVEEEYPLASRVMVNILTGRTHQIRVHLSHLGHPVVGDAEYGGAHKIVGQLKKEHQEPAKQCLGLIKRQALHSRTLKFTHPVLKKEASFTAPLPADIQGLLHFLKGL